MYFFNAVTVDSEMCLRIVFADGSEQTTISSLVDKLASWLSIVDVLWEVYTNGECSVFKIPPSSRSTNSARTTCLLSALYSAVVTHDHMGEYSSQMVRSGILFLLFGF